MDNYLNQMGYLNTPMVAYRHADKDHDHWHFICTVSDFDGKLINTRNDHHRSSLISRELEKAYGLQQLSQASDSKSVNDKRINAEKYRLYHAINSLRKELERIDLPPEHQWWLKSGFEILDRSGKMKSQLTRDQIKNIFKQANILEEFNRMERGLKRLGFLKPSIIEQVKERAMKCRNESSSISELVRKFGNEKLGFYARDIKSKNGVSFGLRKTKDNGLTNSYYPSIKELGKAFETSELVKYFEAKKKGQSYVLPKQRDLTFDDVKKYVKASIQKASAITNEWPQFKCLLSEKYKIDPELKTGSNGTTMLSFIHSDYRIKSSALGLSHPAIVQKLDGNKKHAEAVNEFGKRYDRQVPLKPTLTRNPSTQGQHKKPVPSPSMGTAFNMISKTNPEWINQAIQSYFNMERQGRTTGQLPSDIRSVFNIIDELGKNRSHRELYQTFLNHKKQQQYFRAVKALAVMGLLDTTSHHSAIQGFIQNAISSSENIQQFIEKFNHNIWGYQAGFQNGKFKYRILPERNTEMGFPNFPSMDEVNHAIKVKSNFPKSEKERLTSQVWQVLHVATTKKDLKDALNRLFNITCNENLGTFSFNSGSVKSELTTKQIESRLLDNKKFVSVMPRLISEYNRKTRTTALRSDLSQTLFTLRSVLDRDAFIAEQEIERDMSRNKSRGPSM